MCGLLDYLEQISFFFIAEFVKKVELYNQNNLEYIGFMHQQDFYSRKTHKLWFVCFHRYRVMTQSE